MPEFFRVQHDIFGVLNETRTTQNRCLAAAGYPFAGTGQCRHPVDVGYRGPPAVWQPDHRSDRRSSACKGLWHLQVEMHRSVDPGQLLLCMGRPLHHAGHGACSPDGTAQRMAATLAHGWHRLCADAAFRVSLPGFRFSRRSILAAKVDPWLTRDPNRFVRDPVWMVLAARSCIVVHEDRGGGDLCDVPARERACLLHLR